MNILFISARYIYVKNDWCELHPKYEQLPIFKNIEFANKLKNFSQNGNVIAFVDVWPDLKKHNKELMEFFGSSQNRGDILFYKCGYVMKRLIDQNLEEFDQKYREYLEDISLGTNWNDMNLLLERITNFYYTQGKCINNIYTEIGDFENLTLFEKTLFGILTKQIQSNQLKTTSLCHYQTCKRGPIKILFTDKDGTIFKKGITRKQEINNRLAIQEFTNQGNIVVVITNGHGSNVFDDFGIGYTNSNLYGITKARVASVCENNTGEIIRDIEYPSLPIAIGLGSDKKEAVKLFLEYFLEMGYTFNQIYAIGDSKDDYGMIEYVKEIGGVGKLIGKDIDNLEKFIRDIKDDDFLIKTCLNQRKKYVKS